MLSENDLLSNIQSDKPKPISESDLLGLSKPPINNNKVITSELELLNDIKPFDPEGSGYDMSTAVAAGLSPDKTGHWSSRDPRTGMILKGKTHPTWNLTEEGEAKAGMEIYKKDGRYYSRPKSTMSDAKEFYTRKSASPYGVIHPAVSAKMGMDGFGPKPEGGFDELGRPLDANGVPYNNEGIDKDKLGNPIAETLKGLTGFATHPMEVIRGGLDFALSLPGFAVGMLGAAGRGGKILVNQLAYGKLDLDKVYTAMSQGMEESFKFFEPGKKLVTGEPTKVSQMVGEVVMAPLNVISATGQKVAAYEGFKDYPNIRGAAKITGDVVALMSMGFILHGPTRRGEFAKGAEAITKEANDIAAREYDLNQSIDSIVKNVQGKALQVQKEMLESKAAEFARQFGDDIVMTEDMGRQAEQVAKEKVRPVQESPQMVKLFKQVEKADAKAKIEDLKKDAGPEVGKVVTDPETGKKTFRVNDQEVERRSNEYVPTSSKKTIENFPLGKDTDLLVNRYRMEDNLYVDDKDNHKLDTYKEAAAIAKKEGGTVIPTSDGKFAVALEPESRVKFERDALNVEEPKVTILKRPAPPEIPFKPGDKVRIKEGARGRAIHHEESFDLMRSFGVGETKITDSAYKGILKKTRDYVEKNYGKEALAEFNSTLNIEVEWHKSEKLDPKGVSELIALDRVLDKYGVPKEIPAKAKGDVVVLRKKKVEEPKVETPEVDEELSPEVKKYLDRMIEEDETGTYDDIDYGGEGKTEPIKQVDRATGTKPVEVEESNSAFAQDKEKTYALAKMFEERKKSVQEDPEVYVQKLINDLNRFRHGEKINKVAVSNKLSEMAVKAEELRDYFMTGADHMQFVEVVREAAKWARDLGVPKGDLSTRLNTMIPVDKVPDLVRQFIMKVKEGTGSISTGDILRNVRLWKETGFWLGMDGKFRYELDDSEMYVDWVKLSEATTISPRLINIVDHPNLFKAVPDMANTIVAINKKMKANAYYDQDLDVIFIRDLTVKHLVHEIEHAIEYKTNSVMSPTHYDFLGASVSSETQKVAINNLKNLLQIATSEVDIKNIKSIINDIGSGKGTSIDKLKTVESKLNILGLNAESFVQYVSDKGFKNYRLNPGEMEARVVEKRLDMSSKERAEEPPWVTLDKMLNEEGYSSVSGNKLYSGLPFDKVAKLVKKGYKELRAEQEVFGDQIKGWLMGSRSDMPKPDSIYRGVYKGQGVRSSEELNHGTPWSYEAARGGKGGFGDPSSHDVYEIPASKDTKYYRGGSLAGDPLERTRIDSSKGMTWESVMNKAKEIYYQDLAKLRASEKKNGREVDASDEMLLADRVLDDVRKATFETDMEGKKGIWSEFGPDRDLSRDYPKLRHIDVVRDVAEAKRRAGYTDDQIPELKILGEVPSGDTIKAYHWSKGKLSGDYDFSRLGENTKGNNLQAVESAKLGAWFTESDKPIAEGLKEKNEVRLTLKNPLVLDNKSVPAIDVMGDKIQDAKQWLMDEVDRAGGGKKLQDKLKKEGYDGIVLEDSEFGNAKSYVVFDKKQISTGGKISSSETSDNFTKWFGNSKVKEIVYHGSPSRFTEFDNEKRYGGIGIHFGTREQAINRMKETVKTTIDMNKSPKSTLFDGHIKLENPVDFPVDAGIWNVESVKNMILSEGIESKFPKTMRRISQLAEDYDTGKVHEYESTKRLEALFKEEGYDGFTYPNNVEGKGKSFAVFDSNQFKSTKNVGSYDSNTGNVFYSGDPVIEAAAKAIIAGAKKVAEYTTKARGMKAFKPGEAAKLLREEFNRSFLDRSGNIRNDLIDKLGEDGAEVLRKLVLSKGASAQSAMALKQMAAEVYEGLSRREKKILDDIILDDRMVDIAKYKSEAEFKFPKGLTVNDFIAHRELFPKIEGITPERASLLDARAKAYFEWMKKPLQDMLEAGLIDQKEYDALASHNYRRIKLVEIYDKKKPGVGSNKKSVYDSGVEALSRGRDTDIYEPSSEIMALEVFNRAYGRIMNNEANKTLLDLARKDPSNEFARVKNEDVKIPPGWSRVFAYEDGERKTVFINPEMAKEWINSSPEMSYRLSQLVRWGSGSVVTRTFATGIEWGFALANLPRDMMHLWFTARTFEGDKGWKPIYNPNIPVFGLQIGRDLGAVFSDAAGKKGRYLDYIKEGGGMEFLVHQGRLFQRGRHIDSAMDKVYNTLGYFGETSEIMTRLAIRERVIRRKAREQGISMEEARKDKKITSEATFTARDYMDFGQGGGIAKALDNGMPYLNAAIQGTRGLVRSFKPGSGSALSSTYKLAQLATITTGVYLAAKSSSPNTMQNLQGDVAMQNNLCIPLGDSFGFEDEQGQVRYPYFKIPLDPGQKFFKTFFEAAADKWVGNEVDVDRVTGALSQLSPVGMSSLPPTVAGALGYLSNRDYWLNEDIWKRTDKPFSYPNSKEEYTNRTPQMFKDVGQTTGLSPERTKYALEQLITRGSMWSYLVNQGYDKAFGDLTKEKKEQHLAMILSEIPVIKRFFGVTKPYSKYAKAIDEASEGSTIKRFVENRGMDTLVDSYLYGKNTSRDEVIKYANSFKDLDTYDRLIDRLKWEEAIKSLPEKSFWRRMKGLAVDAKARVFVDRLNSSTEAQKDQLWKEFGIVGAAGDVISDSFMEEVTKLRSAQR